jgi:hypothetical protein
MAEQVNLNTVSRLWAETTSYSSLLVYTYRSFASVGYTAEYAISQPDVLRMTDHRHNYLHPELVEMEEYCGGDEAEGVFVFQASKPGTAILTISDLYRGDLESRHSYEITISGAKLTIKRLKQ